MGAAGVSRKQPVICLTAGCFRGYDSGMEHEEGVLG